MNEKTLKMCVYHYEDSKRAERMIWILLLAGICFSAGVTVPMFILTYPGDECLLFVSVRGEALIYGNPAGCHFISYGHVTLILSGKSFLVGKLKISVIWLNMQLQLCKYVL